MYIPDGSDNVAIRVLPFWDVAYSALMPFVSNRVAESVPLTVIYPSLICITGMSAPVVSSIPETGPSVL